MSEIQMTPVTSSQVHSIGYDPETLTLHVRFHDRTNKKTDAVIRGATYAYAAIEPELHEALINAESIGGHFHTHVRNGGYDYKQIKPCLSG